MDRQRIVVPVTFPDPDRLPYTFVETLSSLDVVLLGYYDLPDGESVESLRAAEQTDAWAVLYDLAAKFSRNGARVEPRLVFGGEDDSLRNRIAAETDCDAVLIPNPISTAGRVLVAMRDDRNADRIARFLDAVEEQTLIHATLLHVAPDEEAADAGREMLADAREVLVEGGLSDLAIDTEVEVSDDPVDAISRAAADHDFLVMGETQQTVEARVFGPTYERIADRTDEPVILIRDRE